ncbi:MAG: hypothetical protein KIG60_02650 [Caryophanon sp.]|nr:hypothetical protein [Caryophanon sp.]
MAKNKKNEQIEELEVQKSPGIFQKLFYWFLIPLMFLLAVVLVVAEISNVNVFEKARETASSLPFISSDDTKDGTTSSNHTDVSGGKVLELQSEIMEKEAQIADLQAQITTANSEKEQMLIEQEKLAFELERLQREQESSSVEFEEVVKAYEAMSPKKSAAAIAQLPDAEALRILSNLKTATVAKLFEKMDPEKVAHYTTLMTE